MPASSVTAGTYTYMCKVANSACTLSSNTYSVEVLPAPAITLSGGAANQTLELPCDTVVTMIYSAPGASFAFSGSLPAGVTYTASGASLTIAGKPSAPGAFDYTLTATLGACTATASGSITVTGSPDAPPGAQTDQVWCVGGRAWSDAIALVPAGCMTEDVAETNSDPIYYWNNLYPGSGYLYNGVCLLAAAVDFCPSPWRVPTYDDFCELDKALFGATTCTNRSGVPPSDLDKYVDEWGAVYGGWARIFDGPNYGGEQAYYWAFTTAALGVTMMLDNQTDAINPQFLRNRHYGSQVRCVKAALGPYIINHPGVNSEVCEGSTLTLRVVAANATAYQWKKDGVDVTDGTGGTSATYTTGALTANATYTVVVSDGTYSVTSNEVPVIVVSYPTTAPTLTASAGTVCEGTAITFTPTGGSKYNWNCSGFTCSYNDATQTTPTTAGTYSAQVRTWNGSSVICYSPYSPVVTVEVLGPGVRGESSACGCQAPYIRCCSTCVDPDLSYNLSEAERTTDPTVCYKPVQFSYKIFDEATCMSKCLSARSTSHPNLCAYTHEDDGSCYCVQNR
jgi:uncharacterized protein (TIGR02145 family)